MKIQRNIGKHEQLAGIVGNPGWGQLIQGLEWQEKALDFISGK